MRALLVCSLVCIFALSVLPPASAEDIPRDVVGSGGGKSTSANHQVLHTVGQSVINVVSGSGTVHEQGFWYPRWLNATGAGEDGSVPLAYRLDQNYPNPFNPTTTIRFALTKPSWVTLKVYDVLGRLAKTVVDGQMDAGVHTMPYEARGMASGVYFYRIRAAEFEKTRKMVILR